MLSAVRFLGRGALCASLLLFGGAPVSAQVGTFRTPIFDDDSVKSNQAAIAAADAKRRRDADEILKRDRQNLEQEKASYAAEREEQRSILSDISRDSPEYLRRLDFFKCMYPPLEDLPPKALVVDRCVRARVLAREEEKRRELEKQLAEQREVERQQALAESVIKAEEQRQREVRKAQAELEEKRAEKAAQFRATVLGWIAFLLGVTVLSYVCYKYRTHAWLSMSKAKVSVGLVGLFVIYVAAMPYITVHQMKSAAENHDGEALSEYIEFPSVRQSLKDQMNAMFITKMAEDSELRGNPFAALGAAIAGRMVDSMVDAIVTPTGVARLMSGEKPRAGQGPGGAGSSGRKPLADASMSYETLDKFVVTVKTNEGGEGKFVLRRRGLNWKLTEIKIPLE